MTEIFLALDAQHFANLEGLDDQTSPRSAFGRAAHPQAVAEPCWPVIGLAEPNPAGLIRNCRSTFAARETGAPSPSIQAVIRTRAPRLPRMAKLFDRHRLSEIARLVDVGSQDKRSVVG